MLPSPRYDRLLPDAELEGLVEGAASWRELADIYQGHFSRLQFTHVCRMAVRLPEVLDDALMMEAEVQAVQVGGRGGEGGGFHVVETFIAFGIKSEIEAVNQASPSEVGQVEISPSRTKALGITLAIEACDSGIPSMVIVLSVLSCISV